MEAKPNKIMVGMPISKDQRCDVHTGMYLGILATRADVTINIAPTPSAEWGRNHIVKGGMKNPDITHFFFVDSDVRFPITALDQLITQDKDIIAGVTPMYFDKHLQWSASLKMEGELYRWIPKDELPEKTFKCLGLGGTTILIRREVFEAIGFPYYQMVYREDLVKTEDVVLCERAKAAGYELWCDPTIKCGHQQTNNLRDLFNLW